MKSIAKSSQHRAENHRSRPIPLLVLSLALLIGLAWMVLGSSGHASEPPPRHNPEPGSEASPGEALSFSGLSGPHLPIEPDLLRQVLSADPGAMHNILVELAQQADLEQLPDGLSRTDRQAEIVGRLKSTAQETQAELLTFLQNERARGKVDNLRPFWVFNGLALTADGETLLAIAGRPEVRLVREDRRRLWVEPMSVETDLQQEADTEAQWNIQRIGADAAWNTLGIDGTGTTIAIVDTGVDWQHPALQAQYRGYKPAGLAVHEGNWFCATDEGYLYPGDGHGHGTHVTGSAVGRQDADGVSIGVAPGAQWIAVKALDDLGYAYDSWIHAAFEWILAPGGDPSLAPDVVNSSWGYRDDQYEAFRPDVQALRAAGIVPVFSAGNQGPMAATLDSPASYPEALSVGATDDLDLVTSFSSRGPSPWGEIKPEIAAPGAQIRSSLPGGRYGFGSGTSMASPQVAGVAALILQAQPALSVDDVESVLVSSAKPLGDPIPNNDSGWGRVDAYQAAAVAAQAGFVTGQVTHLPDQQPLSTAQVTAYNHLGEQQATVRVDEMGRYLLALPAGIYDIQASAFGYKSYTAGNVLVQASTSVTLDLKLSPAPAGILWGEVRNAETGGPVSAQVSIEGTPARTTSDPQTGQYSLSVPAGTYTVTAEQNGYRRAAATGLEVVVNQATRADLALTPAPTLLLVDSGRWYYGSQAAYFETALRDRNYVYDLWEVRDAVADRPVLADLEPYDLIVWSSPLDSPEMIRAGDVISDYLGLGGNLLLSGQDVGFWDDGLSGLLYHPYVGQFLRAKVLADNAGRDDLVGVGGEVLDGLVLPINDPDSAGNQTAPDLIDLLDPQDARLIAEYQGVGGAALRASGCQSYRAVYLAAGLEGLGSRASRAEVLDRALTWLDSPHPTVGTRLAPISQESVWLGSPYITYTVELQNRGQSADRFDLELSPSAWPVSVFDGDFTQAITRSMVLGTCQTQTVGVQIAVPPDVGWNATDVVTLTARSQSGPGVAANAVFSSKSPAPILLVDDHRWYDTSDRYRTALEARQMPYDMWSNAQSATPDIDGPSLRRLERYPVVVWFTAYDWFETLTPEQEAALATYLDGGGRLLLSSQDYLYTSRFTDFARNYLGVFRYTDDLPVTQTVGAVGDPIGQGLGPMDLVYPFRNFSDALRPNPSAGAAFWGQHGQPVALTKHGAAWKTTFYAFSLEALGPSDLATVVGNTVDWLSPLGDSALAVDSPVASAGAVRTYTLTIRNTGPRPLANASLSNPVPPYTAFVPGSLEGPAVYDPGAQSITWAGALDPGQAITITYRLEIDRPLPDGTIIENVAQLGDETGLGLERASTVWVDSPYLRGSTMSVSAGISPPGRVLTYTVILRNDGLRQADARLTDRIPANSFHTPDSGWASSGVLTSTAQLLVWSGTIAAENAVTITFPVVITPSIEGFYVYNRASLTDGWGDTVPLETHTLVETYLLLPLVLKGF